MKDFIIIAVIIALIRFWWNNLWYKAEINHMEGKDYYARRKRNGTWYYYDKRTGKKIGYSTRDMDYIEYYQQDDE